MGTEGRDSLDEIEAALPGAELDTLKDFPPPPQDQWERPTKARIRAIESRVEPATYPPASSVGRRWTPAGVVLVLTAFGAMCVTAGGALGPLFMKPDLTGYVKEERLTACEVRVTAAGEASEKAIDRERERTSACYDKLGACQSQQGANETVIEGLTKKRR